MGLDVNDISKYLTDADTLADMIPAEDDSVGVAPDVPLSEIALEPETVPVLVEGDPYVATLPCPHAPPGPAEQESLAGMAPDLLPRSQDVDLVSAIDIPLPPSLRAYLRSWTREDLDVRVFQGVRRGGPPAHRVWCRETFAMETGDLLAREFLNPDQSHVVRLPSPALPGCSPMTTDRRSIRSVFWYSETDVLPAHLSRLLPRGALRGSATHGGPAPLVSSRGEDGEPSLEHVMPKRQEEGMSPGSGGASSSGDREDDIQSQDSFETATSQGYRTEEDEGQEFSLSMVNLGWLSEGLRSDDWVKVMDQPPVRIMKITLEEDAQSKKDKNYVMEDNEKGAPAKTYYVADLTMSKQQELVEASFQLRSRILEFSASSFTAIPLELVPLVLGG